jgi:DNA-binding NarL/FixJ family response regulator
MIAAPMSRRMRIVDAGVALAVTAAELALLVDDGSASPVALAAMATAGGAPVPLPEGVELSAYRIVQEALTNAHRHTAPTRVTVRLAYRADGLKVTVLDDEVAGEAEDGAAAVTAARELRPDVVLMDVRMPEVDGVEATARLVEAELEPAPRIIVLTTFHLDEYVFGAIRAGAAGFLLKHASSAQLLDAIHTVHAGDVLLSPSITRRLIEHVAAGAAPRPAPEAALAELTPREREMLVLVARGLSNGEIADRLVISEATVKSHVGAVLAKLGLRARVQAVVYAYEHGIVVAGDQR